MFIEKATLLWKKGAFHIIIGNFLTKFLVFFGSILLVRSLSKSEYGTLAFIENTYGYLYLFAGLGLANGILRFIVLSENQEKENSYYRYITNLSTFINMFLLLLGIIVVYFIPFNSNLQHIKALIILYFLTLPFQYLIDINFYTLRSKLENSLFAITTLLYAVILIYGKYLGAYLFDIQGVIIFSLLINVFFAFGIYKTVTRKYFKKVTISRLNNDEKRNLNKYSIQYMLTNGIWILFMLNDILLLNIFTGDPELLAEYKVAYVIPANLAIFNAAIGIFIAPYFIKNEKDNIWVMNNYKKILFITFSVLGISSLIIGYFTRDIILLLFGEEYLNIVNIMQLLLISSFINNTFRYTTANLLAAMGKIKINMTISIVGIFSQLLFNIILIPKYGLYGVAFTNILVFSLMSFSIIYIFVKIYSGKNNDNF